MAHFSVSPFENDGESSVSNEIFRVVLVITNDLHYDRESRVFARREPQQAYITDSSTNGDFSIQHCRRTRRRRCCTTGLQTHAHTLERDSSPPPPPLLPFQKHSVLREGSIREKGEELLSLSLLLFGLLV